MAKAKPAAGSKAKPGPAKPGPVKKKAGKKRKAASAPGTQPSSKRERDTVFTPEDGAEADVPENAEPAADEPAADELEAAQPDSPGPGLAQPETAALASPVLSFSAPAEQAPEPSSPKLAWSALAARALQPLGGGPAFLAVSNSGSAAAVAPSTGTAADNASAAVSQSTGTGTAAGAGSEPETKLSKKSRHKARLRARKAEELAAQLGIEPPPALQQPALTATPLPKPVLLFDLNGTLTSHTAMKNSTGITKTRPGLHHLHRLHERFRLGVFSSASALTVNKALTMINEAAPAAEGQPNIFRWGRLTYTRSNTQAVQQAHIDAGGNEWDTVKPLAALVPKIGPLHRVLLIDDDAYKSVPGERDNLVLVPRWDDTDESDIVVEALVDSLLQLIPADSTSLDVRLHSTAVAERVAEISGKEPAQAAETQPAVQDDDDAAFAEVYAAKQAAPTSEAAAGAVEVVA